MVMFMFVSDQPSRNASCGVRTLAAWENQSGMCIPLLARLLQQTTHTTCHFLLPWFLQFAIAERSIANIGRT
jgi:hypothetical protein